jgi:hypothetical protein
VDSGILLSGIDSGIIKCPSLFARNGITKVINGLDIAKHTKLTQKETRRSLFLLISDQTKERIGANRANLHLFSKHLGKTAAVINMLTSKYNIIPVMPQCTLAFRTFL